MLQKSLFTQYMEGHFNFVASILLGKHSFLQHFSICAAGCPFEHPTHSRIRKTCACALLRLHSQPRFAHLEVDCNRTDGKVFADNETIRSPAISNMSERHKGGERLCGFFLREGMEQTGS